MTNRPLVWELEGRKVRQLVKKWSKMRKLCFKATSGGLMRPKASQTHLGSWAGLIGCLLGQGGSNRYTHRGRAGPSGGPEVSKMGLLKQKFLQRNAVRPFVWKSMHVPLSRLKKNHFSHWQAFRSDLLAIQDSSAPAPNAGGTTKFMLVELRKWLGTTRTCLTCHESPLASHVTNLAGHSELISTCSQCWRNYLIHPCRAM